MSDLTVELDGRRYTLPNFANPTFREAREITAATGHPPVKLLSLLEDGDPDAWGRVVLMAMRQHDPRTPDDALDDVDLFPLIASMTGGPESPLGGGDVDGAEG